MTLEHFKKRLNVIHCQKFSGYLFCLVKLFVSVSFVVGSKQKFSSPPRHQTFVNLSSIKLDLMAGSKYFCVITSDPINTP